MAIPKNSTPRRLSTSSASFAEEFSALLSVQEDNHENVLTDVRTILKNVKDNGDAALLEYSNKFDGISAETFAELEISKQQMASAVESIDPIVLEALSQSIERVRSYHQKQKEADAAHAPGVTQSDSRLAQPHRVHMQEHVREHDQHPVPIVDRRGVPENGCPNLRFGNPLPGANERWGFRFDGLRSHVSVSVRRRTSVSLFDVGVPKSLVPLTHPQV